jgi:hypothetical protein
MCGLIRFGERWLWIWEYHFNTHNHEDNRKSDKKPQQAVICPLQISKEGNAPRKYTSMKLSVDSQKAWYLSVQIYLLRWVEEHKDGRADTWTPDIKKAINKKSVWK